MLDGSGAAATQERSAAVPAIERGIWDAEGFSLNQKEAVKNVKVLRVAASRAELRYYMGAYEEAGDSSAPFGDVLMNVSPLKRVFLSSKSI